MSSDDQTWFEIRRARLEHQELREQELRDLVRRRRAQERLHARRRPFLAAAAALTLAAAGAVAFLVGVFDSTSVKVVRVVLTTPLPPAASSVAVPVLVTAAASAPSTTGTVAASHPPKRPEPHASPTTRPAAGGLLRGGAASSFATFEQNLPGPVGVAVAPVASDGETVLGDDAPAHGWSTTKVPVLVALIAAREAAGGGLNASERQEAELAITESDNQSILDLFADLEGLEGGLEGASQYITQLLRESGDDQTVVATAPPPAGAVTTFGQTEWPPSEAVKFFKALGEGCLLPPGDTGYVLNLMQHIIPSESWGLGSASFDAPAAFKGGWGPESGGYLVRQSGVLDPGSSKAMAVSIVAHPPPGGDSFSVGTQMVTATADWLAREIVLTPRQGASCVNPF